MMQNDAKCILQVYWNRLQSTAIYWYLHKSIVVRRYTVRQVKFKGPGPKLATTDCCCLEKDKELVGSHLDLMASETELRRTHHALKLKEEDLKASLKTLHISIACISEHLFASLCTSLLCVYFNLSTFFFVKCAVNSEVFCLRLFPGPFNWVRFHIAVMTGR